jgi:hypothetical protein
MKKRIPMCPWLVKNAAEPHRTAVHSGQPRRKPLSPSSKQPWQTYNNGRGSTMWARKNKHNLAASRHADEPADSKSTSAHMLPQMQRKDDHVKTILPTYSKETAMTRAYHFSLQIDEQANRKLHEHTQDASLGYRYRRTDPERPILGSIGFRGMEWRSYYVPNWYTRLIVFMRVAKYFLLSCTKQ